MTEHPEQWVVVEFKTPEETVLKVLASWYGGYLGSDEWRLNSGIKSTTKVDNYYLFESYSGSLYECHEQRYGMSNYTSSIYASMVKKFEGQDGYSIRILDEAEVTKLGEVKS